MRSRPWRPLAVVAALANAGFLLAGPLGARVQLSTGVISELSVPGQPGAGWFRLGDATAGVLCTALAWPLLRAARRRDADAGPRARLRAGCLALFGVTTFASALVPLTCAPSLQACAASAAGPEVFHDGVSVLGTAAAVVGALDLLRRLRTRPLGVPALLAALGSAGAGLYEVVTFAQGGNGGGGNSQRLQVLSVSLWVLLEVWSWDPPYRGPSRGRNLAANTSP